MKIVFILFIFPFLANAQYVNLLNNKPIANGATIKQVVAEQDSLVFTGNNYIFDSTVNEYINQFFIGKVANNNPNGTHTVNIFTKKYKTHHINKLFKKSFGYTVVLTFTESIDSFKAVCGYYLINFNRNLDFIDSSKFIFKENNFLYDSTGVFGVYNLFSEVIINNKNNYVFTIIYPKKRNLGGNFELGNAILELSDKGKLITNKTIEFDDKAPQINSSISLSPIVNLQEINLNDSIKYLGFNGYNLGGQVYLDSLFNIKKVTNFLISLPIKASEYRFQYAFIKSVKHNGTVYVAGVGDSIAREGQNAEDYIPSIIIKKIVNNQTIRTLCIQTVLNYSLIDDIQFDPAFQNYFLNVNERGEIMVSMVVSARYTFLALLDSNLNLVWEKYLERNSPWATGIIGATTAFDNNGFYFYGHYCTDCTLNSTPSDISGVIGYVGNNGNLLGLNKKLEVSNNHLNIYPNPATDKLFIKNNSTDDCKYFIFSLLGDLIDSGLMKSEINISNLVNGVYVLKITCNNNQSQVLKFVKQ